MIVEFAGKEAISTLPKLLVDEVDRIRAVDLVFDIAVPVDEMDAPTLAMFRRLTTVLRTLPRDWKDPEHEIKAHKPGAYPGETKKKKSSKGERKTRRKARKKQADDTETALSETAGDE